MNGKELLEVVGYISPKYYEEAENETFAAPKKGLRKPFLAAALVAVSLLLAGCTAVVLMKMQDLKVGEQEVTNPVYNEYMEFQGNETVAQQVLNLAGLKGSPSYQATKEWYEFNKTYDQDHAILNSVWGKTPEFPHEFDAYNVYSQDMVDKVAEIAEKHNLKLQGSRLKLHSGKRFYEEMGIDSLLMPESKATVKIDSPFAYENGSCGITVFWMTMPEEDGQWPYQMLNSLYYNKKDCFSTDLMTLEDTGDWEEWNYTTASGQNVLILLSPSNGIGWIICDRADAMISIRVTVSHEAGYNEDGKSWFEELGHMSREQFEQVADAIDFNMKPVYQGEAESDVDTTVLSQTNNGYTIEVKDVQTDGYAAFITLGVTGPEGTNLMEHGLINGNWASDDFEPASGKEHWGSRTMPTEDDGDGLDNTCNLVIIAEPYYEDRSEMPFSKDAVWNVYFEDLKSTWWDEALVEQKEELLAEGTWSFDITFENGNFREIEMVTEPVTTTSLTAWSPKDGDIFEDVEITSIKLRSCSATITHSGDATVGGTPDTNLVIVMKDGSELEMLGGGGIYDFGCVIDLDQVDHIRLPDGTKLPAPQ